jgi:hypothetical protein
VPFIPVPRGAWAATFAATAAPTGVVAGETGTTGAAGTTTGCAPAAAGALVPPCAASSAAAFSAFLRCWASLPRLGGLPAALSFSLVWRATTPLLRARLLCPEQADDRRVHLRDAPVDLHGELQGHAHLIHQRARADPRTWVARLATPFTSHATPMASCASSFTRDAPVIPRHPGPR